MAEDMDFASFDDLLNKAEHLTAEIDDNMQLPRIERNIKQLFEVGQSLWTRTGYQSSRDTNDVRASVLLGSKGYDLQKVSQQLENLNASKKLSSIESSKVHDIHGFLRNERENAVLSAIEEVKKRTFELVDNSCWAKIEKDWEDQKQTILNALVGEDKDDLNQSSVDQRLTFPSKLLKDESLIVDRKDLGSYSQILSDLKSSQNDKLFTTSLSKLVRDNKDYDQILGYMDQDGNRVAGILDKYSDDPQSVVKQIAIDCENAGLIEESIKLYDLCSEQDKALEILIKHLNPLVSSKKSPGSKRDLLEAIALKLAERFCTAGHKSNKQLVGVLFLLLDLMTFFDYYHNQAYEDAIDVSFFTNQNFIIVNF